MEGAAEGGKEAPGADAKLQKEQIQKQFEQDQWLLRVISIFTNKGGRWRSEDEEDKEKVQEIFRHNNSSNKDWKGNERSLPLESGGTDGRRSHGTRGDLSSWRSFGGSKGGKREGKDGRNLKQRTQRRISSPPSLSSVAGSVFGTASRVERGSQEYNGFPGWFYAPWLQLAVRLHVSCCTVFS